MKYRRRRSSTIARHMRRGFTLIELLVVMVIVATLMAIVFPAVAGMRNSARATHSRNNLRQMALAFHQHEASKGYFPPSWQASEEQSGANVDGWSMHALILPYLEQQIVSSEIDFTRNYNYYVGATAPLFQTADGRTTRLSAMRVATYISPGEPRDEVRDNQHYPHNYAVNVGTYFVYDPVTGNGGAGAAYPNSRLRSGAFADGMSTTLCLAEVRAWQPYFRNTGSTATALALSLASDALGRVPDVTVTPAQLGALIGSPDNGGLLRTTGHTEWVDGRCHHSGFTTLFRPNTKVLCGNADGSVNTTGTGVIDVDWNNQQEGRNLGPAPGSGPTDAPTFAAVTARGYFGNVVNVAMMDGSVRTIDDKINIGVWRALSTRASKEMVPNSIGQ